MLCSEALKPDLGLGVAARTVGTVTIHPNQTEGCGHSVRTTEENDVSIEWGVMKRNGEFWRGPMTESEAREWVREAVEDGMKPGVFVVCRRAVGDWSPDPK